MPERVTEAGDQTREGLEYKAIKNRKTRRIAPTEELTRSKTRSMAPLSSTVIVTRRLRSVTKV